MRVRARCAFRWTRVLGIRDSRELELARKEFAKHPLHMTNRLLFARPSTSSFIETDTGMNYSRRDIDMLTRDAKQLYFNGSSSFAIIFDIFDELHGKYLSPLIIFNIGVLKYLSFRPFIVDFISFAEFT